LCRLSALSLARFVAAIDDQGARAYGYANAGELVNRLLFAPVEIYRCESWHVLLFDKVEYIEIASYGTERTNPFHFEGAMMAAAVRAFELRHYVLFRVKDDLSVILKLCRRARLGDGERRLIEGELHRVFYFDRACFEHWIKGGDLWQAKRY
jgi:hypothetical protein